jgi:hypothetical protein
MGHTKRKEVIMANGQMTAAGFRRKLGDIIRVPKFFVEIQVDGRPWAIRMFESLDDAEWFATTAVHRDAMKPVLDDKEAHYIRCFFTVVQDVLDESKSLVELESLGDPFQTWELGTRTDDIPKMRLARPDNGNETKPKNGNGSPAKKTTAKAPAKKQAAKATPKKSSAKKSSAKATAKKRTVARKTSRR